MSSTGREGYVGASQDAVAAAEIRSLKPDARVYEKRTPNLFFLTSKKVALENIERRRDEEKKVTGKKKDASS